MTKRWRYRYAEDRTFGRRNWRSPFPVAVNVDPKHFKCPLPRNDADFAILSEIFFGVPLSLSKLWFWSSDGKGTGQAEIAERYDSFAEADGYFGRSEIAGYDRLSWFWQTVLGPMGSSRSLTFTTFRVASHRQQKRIANWIECRRSNRGSTPSEPFVRLARRYGAGENIVDRNRPPESGVLLDGRVDGASTAFLASSGLSSEQGNDPR